MMCEKPGEKETKSGSVVLDSPGDKIRLLPAEANWTGRYISDRLGNGQQLGEYEVVGSFDGRTFYKQRDTLRSSEEGTSLGSSVLAFDGSGPKLFGYCLGKCGRWYVGFKVGEIATLRNTQDTPTPPNSGWEVSRQGNWTKDNGVTLRGGGVKICRVVMVHGQGETARLQGSSFGAYTPTDQWSYGRPVYKKAAPPTRYLLVDQDIHGFGAIWAVKSSTRPGTEIDGWYLTSFNAPNEPSTLERDDWQHWKSTENKLGKGEWATAQLRVYCPFELKPLTPPSTWDPTVMLSTSTIELVGQGLGEFLLEESYNGRPFYGQP